MEVQGMASHELLASLLGYTSIVCWIVVFTPQYYKNYSDKNTDGVSLPFLLCWILGDVCSVLGAVLGNLMKTVLLLALYYLCADSFLMGQVLYYQYIYNTPQTMYDLLLRIKPSTIIKQDEMTYNTITISSPSSSSSSSNNQSNDNINDKETLPLLASANIIHAEKQDNYPSERTQRIARLFIVCSILLWIFLLLGSACYFFWPWAKVKVDLEQWHFVSQTCGWASAFLYCVSRIPQIMKNFRSESVDGLSLTMFVFSLAGNLTYCISILLKSTDRTFLLINFPWLLGSGGTLFFDLMIFFQFYTYRHHSKSSTLEL
ncbi:PQ loop repeat-domain-containing protein [Absidia repens]|uniref:PQ loop repeat-domain-containing protein n=1 Tax=Absidia repens TaxID=90262 RepID=A0A1X2IDJ7_9FUNG|nr:PQ loop repeat-domain-containing protein [Absidia repens]